jgi:predicted dehydrogenase
MNLTDEMKDRGRRNFLKAIAGAPALAALGVAAVTEGPVKGGPVKLALVGTGDMGNGHLRQLQKNHVDLRALCDINPRRRGAAADSLVKGGWPRPHEYTSWQDMLEKEDLEAVLLACPLWAHSEIAVGCLEARKHVLCEKMMAKSEAECQRMVDAARKNNRLLEIGYQRFYNPMYQAAYNNIIKQGLLGDVFHARLAWHRNSTWRRTEEPPSPDFDPSPWGYPDWEHLLNWRMYRRYSEGLMAELGSHQLTVANWFFDSAPEAVYTAGGIHRYKDGREVFDHVYSIFEYPGGRTVTFSSIQSNAFEDAYEMFMGTKGTLILLHETEAYLFNEGEGPSTRVEVSRQSPNPVLDASATRPGDSPRQAVPGTPDQSDRGLAYRNEVTEFCAAIRTGSPLRCGPQRAKTTAIACVTANQSGDKKTRLPISTE